ncbi:MAG TPA: Tn3 family transposase, partial [Streptosporangiaceae bacterium]|nr:Tn3 family transposase [Streptosporangiaceae bacterium]
DSGFRQVEHAQVALVASRMRPAHVARLNQMVGLGPEPGEGDNGGDGIEDEEAQADVLSTIKASPGNVSLASMLAEITKLEATRAIDLPSGLFTGIDTKVVTAWRARAAIESPSHLRVCGEGTTTVASDSTHFSAYDRNVFTEWHSRYGGRGVLVYWSVESGAMAIHSQLISCTASEVAAMIEGVMRHGSTVRVEGNYVDTHGQSEIGFGITRLLGFDLLPRIKQINHVKLYRPGGEDDHRWPGLEPAMTRRIRWEL